MQVGARIRNFRALCQTPLPVPYDAVYIMRLALPLPTTLRAALVDPAPGAATRRAARDVLLGYSRSWLTLQPSQSTYAPFRAELEDAHVVYRPFICLRHGREHPDTTAVLHALCCSAARRQDLADHLPLLARVRAAVGIALARRNARMVRTRVLAAARAPRLGRRAVRSAPGGVRRMATGVRA